MDIPTRSFKHFDLGIYILALKFTWKIKIYTSTKIPKKKNGVGTRSTHIKLIIICPAVGEKKRRVHLGSEYQHTVHHGWEVLAAAAADGWSHCILDQEGRMRNILPRFLSLLFSPAAQPVDTLFT